MEYRFNFFNFGTPIKIIRIWKNTNNNEYLNDKNFFSYEWYQKQ